MSSDLYHNEKLLSYIIRDVYAILCSMNMRNNLSRPSKRLGNESLFLVWKICAARCQTDMCTSLRCGMVTQGTDLVWISASVRVIIVLVVVFLICFARKTVFIFHIRDWRRGLLIVVAHRAVVGFKTFQGPQPWAKNDIGVVSFVEVAVRVWCKPPCVVQIWPREGISTGILEEHRARGRGSRTPRTQTKFM